MLCGVRSSFMNTTIWPLLTVRSAELNCKPFCVTVMGAAARTLTAATTTASASMALTCFTAVLRNRTYSLLRQLGHERRRIDAGERLQECEQVRFLYRRKS